MPQPEGRQLTLTISTYLTNFAISIIRGQTNFIAKQLFSNIPMTARRGKYWIWPETGWNRVEGKELANAEPPPLGGFLGPQEAEVKARKYGVATNWTDDDLADADISPLGAPGYEQRKVTWITRQAMLRLELDTVNLVRNTAWGLVLTGSSTGPADGVGTNGDFLFWSDPASRPIAMMKNLIRDREFATGVKPNMGLFPGLVLDVITEHPDFLDRIKGGATVDRPAVVNQALLAGMLGLDQILEASAAHDISKEGEPTNMVWSWGTDVYICYKPPSDAVNPEQPAPAYQFTWTGTDRARPSPFQIAANPDGIFINRFNLQRPAAYYAESYLFTGPRAVATQMGLLLKSVVPLRAPITSAASSNVYP